MSAVVPATGEVRPMPNDPSLKAAEDGYREMVNQLTKRRAKRDGIALGDPHDVLIGLLLDDASPVFLDPFQVPKRVLGIIGDHESGGSFAASLIQLRAKWCYPKDMVGAADDNDTASDAQVFRWPHPSEKKPRRAVIVTGRTTNGLMRNRGAARAGIIGDAWSFRGLMFRTTPTEDMVALTVNEREWLPRARMPKEAGYAEGLLWTTWARYPIAIVAATPEYEYLRSQGY
jgi:hypothetical protein